jgi:hypothetical protein
MNTNKILIYLAVGLGLINPLTSIIVAAEHVPNAEPVMLAFFVLPWLVAAEFVRRGKLVAGAIVAGLLSLMNIVSFPGWTRTSALDWTVQMVAATGAAACLALAVTLLVQRTRRPVVAGGAR